MHPRYEIKKTYLIKIDKPITKQQIDTIQKGIKLKDGKTSPAKVKRFEETLLTITIHEGKKRIVRRIFHKLGLKVLALMRTQIGKLELGDLKQGEYRKLTEKDKEKIFS